MEPLAKQRQRQAWLLAARPRTLPLACASILLGSGLAATTQAFNPAVLLLALLTAIALQVLSNLANDYGDAASGADDEQRIGPVRAVSSGLLSPQAMRKGMVITALAATLLGLLLLVTAFGNQWGEILTFVLLGAASLLAAVTYTVGLGGTPYGYRGLGDVAVFIFFGLLGVIGTYYLHVQQLSWLPFLPAAACGLLATAVLNVNNVRDIESDARNGKITLAVRLGRANAIRYHWSLLGLALALTLIYLVALPVPWVGWSCLLVAKPLIDAAKTLSHTRDGEILTGMLKKTAISTLLYSVLLSIGLVLF
ncbi:MULTISPECIES: 1,4-dihydroxy-2-naphthoate polyprenyltransferase [unclassified Halomonas]|uniref:1,4-dihydroxy-2-naphthoate polyprenyltransferase n=1 Tax=Halomonadaceae TaxID=28256 RepID=UPI00022D2FD4|nr:MULTISPECIES: 1,4-dihydroxy-2-naphthoate polyprenyltransferase [unclassified Halomonas]EHA14155.1 1,4-dihydroxy-2-naphthoate octaprenyltransferase [Halomonas sp. HAL1]PKG46959.1 1,4-dihydroxy-2-naphthoate polyprenyltransferase [Halomonas sp. MES3-P3E]WKV92580.1 1,4-dihydroxy-2-naphthoate polyprenyltransferase [Halomonas sp. HAL1]|tara:strand:+ start:9475 stop:10401 length:927 start_codon:yes stop_codon:yes gene_type:complete